MVWAQPDFGKLTQAAYTPARVGQVDIFIAPKNTLTTAAIGKNGVWQYAGRAIAGTFKNEFSQKFYDLMTGTPQTLKESFVIGVEGSIEFTLQEPTGLVYSLATSHGSRIPVYRTSSPVATTYTAASSTTKTSNVASTTGFAVGDEVEFVVAGVSEYTIIVAIDSATAMSVYPLLSAVPANASNVKLVDGWEIGQGSATVTRFAVMSIFNATDAVGGVNHQIVTWAKDVRSEGVKDDMGDGQSEVKIPVSLKAFGYTDAAYNGPIVAKKFIYKPAAAISYTAPAS